MLTHNACQRGACGGSMVKDGYGTTCSLCARADTLPRPPTAEEKWSRGRGAEQPTDYTAGIYAIDYVPTVDELSRAVW
jgi:hypothetical protein